MTVIPNGAARRQVLAAAGWFLARRVGTALIALLGVTVIVFVLSHNVGDPVALIAGQNASASNLAHLRHLYGFDRPLIVQYLTYLGDLVHGDLGTSVFSNRPVAVEIAAVFPATLELSLAALVLGVAVCVPLGVWAALRPNSWVDRLAAGGIRFGVAMPSFWLGILLVFLFVYTWHLLPQPTGQLTIGGTTPPHHTGMVWVDALLSGWWRTAGDAFGHLVLPTVTLAACSFSALLALTQDVVGRVLRSDHFRTTRAMGLPPVTAYARYAFKTAAPPIVTQVAMTFGYLLGGTVLVENVFAWPGIGQYSVLSMQRLDFSPVIAVALLTAAIYLLLYLVADIVALALDPRIRHGR